MDFWHFYLLLLCLICGFAARKWRNEAVELFEELKRRKGEKMSSEEIVLQVLIGLKEDPGLFEHLVAGVEPDMLSSADLICPINRVAICLKVFEQEVERKVAGPRR